MEKQADFWQEIKEQNEKIQNETNLKAARFPKTIKRGRYSGLSKTPYQQFYVEN